MSSMKASIHVILKYTTLVRDVLIVNVNRIKCRSLLSCTHIFLVHSCQANLCYHTDTIFTKRRTFWSRLANNLAIYIVHQFSHSLLILKINEINILLMFVLIFFFNNLILFKKFMKVLNKIFLWLNFHYHENNKMYIIKIYTTNHFTINTDNQTYC